MRQFASTVKKNAIEKRRNIRVTCCECFSHLVIFVILLLGLSLSKIVFFQPENYVKLDVALPPTFIAKSQSSAASTQASDDVNDPNSNSQNGGSEGSSTSLKVSVGSFLTDVKKTLKGPMPIPPFDVYVAIAKFVTNIARKTPATGLILQTSLGMKYGNLLDMGDLHFAPYPSAAVDSLVQHLNKTTISFKTLKIHFHANEGDGVNYILANLDRRAFALIDIRQITPQKINYVIRQNYTTLPNTNDVFISISRGLNRDYQMYLLSGFLTLESTIDRWALNYAVQQADPSATCQSPDVLTVPFPTYEFDSNPFYAQVGFLLGLAMTMSTLYPVSRLIKSVVEEKETRMREIMKIMGLSQFAHQLSWFFTAFVLFFWMSISSTYIAHISFIPKTNILILFIYFFLFHMSEVSLCFLIGVFFSNSKLAAIVGPVILFITILPKYVFFGSNSNEAYLAKYAASLLSPTAFTFGADILAAYEYGAVGVQFSNLDDNRFSMISVFQMMFFDIFLYGFLAWYFDQTLPQEFGTSKHFLFVLNPYYWCPYLKKCTYLKPLARGRPDLVSVEMSLQSRFMAQMTGRRTVQDILSPDVGLGCDFEEPSIEPQASVINQYKLTRNKNNEQCDINRSDSDEVSEGIDLGGGDIEMLSSNQLCDVKVIAHGLEKRYPNGKIAVKDFSLAMLEGQITCLLGHNGAGKSSVIAMITGLTPITAGECTVYDQPLPSALSEIRTMTGICPQQNVLFPTLTVREHLRFFGCIKGSHGKKLLGDVDQMIVDIGLFSKRDTPAASLSGGMKRKLQLAIALIGGSKFLILDEPTSGMDPFSRRATWELLQKHKAGRVILLTTHFLEEADILGDRIAIMSEGHVRCSGSSLFLKTRFGAGYILSISMTQLATLRERKLNNCKSEYTGHEVSHCPMTHDLFQSPHDEVSETSESVESVVRECIPSAVCTSQVAGEIIFSLPIQSVPAFASLFEALGQKAQLLGIESYGVSLTSLEQVFIKLAKEKESTFTEASPTSMFSILHDTAGRILQIVRPTISSLRALSSKVSHPDPKSNCINGNQSKVFPNQSIGYREETKSKTDDNHSNNASGLSVTTTGLTSSMTAVDALSDETDEESKKSFEESPLCPKEESDELGSEHLSREFPKTLTPLSESSIEMVNKAKSPVTNNTSDSDSNSLNQSATWSIDISLKSDETIRQPSIEYELMPPRMKELDFGRSRDGVERSIVEPDFEEKDDFEIHIGDVRTQLIELLRKRLITTSRDLKGLFFQVVFPAIQILLILAILTVNINPAGRTLKMNASIFKFEPNTIVSGRVSPDSIESNLSTSRLIINRYNANTSLQVSVDLLQSGNVLFPGAKALRASLPPPDHRLGAIVIKDKIASTIDVDWMWIRYNFDGLFSNSGVFETLLSTFGIDADSLSNSQSITIPAPAVSRAVQIINARNRTSNLATFNQTIVDRFFKSKFYDSIDSNNQQSVTVQFDGIRSNSNGIKVSNVVLENRGYSVNIGNFELTIAEIKNLLPNRTIEYNLELPFPYTIMHNSSSPHGIAAFRGEVVAATFQQCYANLNITHKQRIANPNVAYLAKNHPLPLTARQSLQNRIILSILASLFILVPLCYIPASFITFIVRERMSKAKHLQLVSSVSPYVYWCSTYLWDMILFTMLVLLIIAALFIYGKKAAEIFISVNEATFAVFLLLFTYGLSVLPLCYIYSMFFDNHSTAQISIMAVNFATGFVAVLAYFVMSTIPTTQEAAEKIVHFFRFFPPYNIGEGLIAIATAFFENTLLSAKISYFSWTVSGRSITFMIVEAIGYFSMVLVTESLFYRKLLLWMERKRATMALKQSVTVVDTTSDADANADVGGVVSPQNHKDEDIIFEEERVRNADKDQMALCIENLVKVYPSPFLGGKVKHAVRGLTLGCQVGERLGFLGVNGAGKSTTLGVLTGDIAPTGGAVYIGGMPLSDPKTRQAIGYCPQTDPLFDLMTARETLWFYGRIRGIETELLLRKIDKLIKQVGLTNFADRTSGTYSGGNKRKLSLAISLIGSPKVLLLDEPSSGMDPFARRQMWDVIAAVSAKRSVVLTTHSMEECEALCTRIGIMVDGSMRCLGPSSHLKARFANGYQIEVRFSDEDRFDEMMCLLRGICEDIEIDERHGQFLRLKVPTLDLRYAFASLEESKVSPTGCVTDYTVCQNTLEQVFLKFAKLQEQVEGVEEHHVDVIALGM